MKKKGLIKKVIIVVVVLIVIGAIAGASGKKGSKKDSSQSEAATQEQKAEEKKSAKAEDEKKSAEDEKNADSSQSEEQAPQEDPKETLEETLIRPEFKEAMDSYEAFFDEYVETMKAYKDDPSDAEALMQMSELMTKEAQMLKEFDDWENEDNMTTAEAAYYLEVQSRVYAKLAEVA